MSALTSPLAGLPYPRIAKKPCSCGKQIRVAYDLDGNRIDLEIEPTRAATYLSIAAWVPGRVYVGAPDPMEHVEFSDRFAQHVHATGRPSLFGDAR